MEYINVVAGRKRLYGRTEYCRYLNSERIDLISDGRELSMRFTTISSSLLAASSCHTYICQTAIMTVRSFK